MNVAIILAGGKGVRTGIEIPKQFVEVLGKPVIAYTLEIFQNHNEIDGIEIVCVKGYEDQLKTICDRYKIDKVKWIVEGGDTYQSSVLSGVNGLRNVCSDDDIITIHTGVAPFLDPDFLTDNLRVCREKGNAITAYQLYALTGKVNDINQDSTNEWVDRDSIMCLKNPHSFKYGLIKKIYDDGIRTGLIDKVEPHTTTLMFEMGIPVYFSKGSQSNIKITKKDDFELFKAFVMMKQNNK